jgi:hypothetical protein
VWTSWTAVRAVYDSKPAQCVLGAFFLTLGFVLPEKLVERFTSAVLMLLLFGLIRKAVRGDQGARVMLLTLGSVAGMFAIIFVIISIGAA